MYMYSCFKLNKDKSYPKVVYMIKKYTCIETDAELKDPLLLLADVMRYACLI